MTTTRRILWTQRTKIDSDNTDPWANYVTLRVPFIGEFDHDAILTAMYGMDENYRKSAWFRRNIGLEGASISSVDDNGDGTMSVVIRYWIGD